jgi:hypothetical protein
MARSEDEPQSGAPLPPILGTDPKPWMTIEEIQAAFNPPAHTGPGRDPYAEGQIRLTRHLAISSQVRVDRRLLWAI